MCLYARDKAKSISEFQTLPRNCVPSFETWILIPLFSSVGNLELCTLFSTKLSIFRLWFLCREFLNCVLSMRRHLSFSFLVAAFLSKQHIYGSPIFFFLPNLSFLICFLSLSFSHCFPAFRLSSSSDVYWYLSNVLKIHVPLFLASSDSEKKNVST